MNRDCQCELEWLDNAPICKSFETADPEDCDDCCIECRHSYKCHTQAICQMDTLKIAMANDGYFDLVEHDGCLHGIQIFIFTVGICCNLTPISYSHRYCYPDLVSARGALKDWQEQQFKGEPKGFIKRK